jgi:hypothetical protein
MGEWSKKVGEAGESLVSEFLKLIGWADAQKGVQIPCVRPEKHESSGTRRTTHGLDFLFSYRSPLMDGVLKNVVISVKFSNEVYPNSPGALFKDHFRNLAESIACYKNSPERRNSLSIGQGIERAQDEGVLFWLNNAPESYDDVIGKVSSVVTPGIDEHQTVYIVDNKRISFIYDALTYARQAFAGSEVEFFYFDTGKNNNPLSKKSSGLILPLEYINTSVLPLRIGVKDSENVVLMLFSIESFSEDGLKRLIGLAHSLSNNWASKIVICFRDYSQLNHHNIVAAVKTSFSDKNTTARIEASSYTIDFRNLQK